MGSFIQDLKFGVRTLIKSPGFTVIAILTLALGIGANSALFSVINGVLLNPLPYPNADQLISVYAKSPTFEKSSITYLNFLDWQKDTKSFSALAAFRTEDLFLTGSGEGERLRCNQISAEFFPLLGIKPVIGRLFRPEDDRVGAPPTVLMNAGLWARKFGSSPDIIGKAITLTGKSYEVIGVIPANFTLYGTVRDVYVPIGLWDDPTFRNRGISFGTNAIGRLKPGVTFQQAQAEMDRIAQNLATAYPESNKNAGIVLVTFKKDLVGEVTPVLIGLLVAVGFVLLIASANVANLLLARANGRTREFAIRSALGAGRMRVVRQLLTESVLLGIAGGALGLLIALWGTETILKTLPQALPRSRDIGVDSHVLLFTLGVSILVGLLFGLIPALRMSRANVQETLKEGGRGTSLARHRTQGIFVVVQMALALVLLVGAGLMIRSITALWGVDPGFNPHNLLTFAMTMPRGIGSDPAKARAIFRQVHQSLVGVPGVTAASSQGGSLPMQGDSELPFWLEGQPRPATQNDMEEALFYLIEPDYLKAMGTRLIRGRFLTEQDTEKTSPVVVIDEYFAAKYYPNVDPIGKRINLYLMDTTPEIVGVAGHVKHWGLDSDAKAPIKAQMYLPLMQIPDRFMPLVADGMGMVVRTQGSPTGVSEIIRKTMLQMNSDQVVYGVQTMDEIIGDYLAGKRFFMILLGVFAGLALVLASIGIYGVISYLVGQRTHEIGIRMALGAQRNDVMKLVVGQGARMAGIGVAVGIVATIGLTRLMAQFLFGVTPTDPVTIIGVSTVLSLVALAACYIPARRAMRTDPIIALRYE